VVCSGLKISIQPGAISTTNRLYGLTHACSRLVTWIELPPLRWMVNGCQSLAFSKFLIRSIISLWLIPKPLGYKLCARILRALNRVHFDGGRRFRPGLLKAHPTRKGSPVLPGSISASEQCQMPDHFNDRGQAARTELCATRRQRRGLRRPNSDRRLVSAKRVIR
jgi:hypothetical protein